MRSESNRTTDSLSSKWYTKCQAQQTIHELQTCGLGDIMACNGLLTEMKKYTRKGHSKRITISDLSVRRLPKPLWASAAKR